MINCRSQAWRRTGALRFCLEKTNCLATARRMSKAWAVAFLVGAGMSIISSAATLSDPQVDAYNVRVGTETFAGMYKFTTNTLLVETAQAITNMGSDTIKLYLASNTSFQSGVTLTAHITNLLTLARDEPSYRKVFDMPFRHFVVWAYPFANSDEWWGSGYNTTKGVKDYQEMYDLTHYLLTNYNNSGKTFYLGHWEGDGYLQVSNSWSLTNPAPNTIQGMIGWLNNRQLAVDDAKHATIYTNVQVYNYAECNRVRDAMNNGTNNNQRVINYVVPYVTNLDYLSYSSYDAQSLSASDLYTTLNYMQGKLPTNKDSAVPGERIWIGEYGHTSWTTDAQEPFNRAYIQRLLNWNYQGKVMPFILFWEMYANYNSGGGTNCCLIDYRDNKVASWYLDNYFYNDARLLVAQFKETNGRLPTDTEFVSLASPLLNQPLSTPVALAVTDLGATLSTNNVASVSGALAQGIYGDSEAGVWVFYGKHDGGAVSGNWESSRFVGVNTNFNPKTFIAVLNSLVPNTNYFYRFYAANNSTNAWAQTSSQFSTVTLNPSDYGSHMKIIFNGYNRGETLVNFPVLVNLSTNLPGFSYRGFASTNGNDLRFTDAGGLVPIPYEIDEWNTNGASSVWVNVPSLSTSNDFIWACWGNPAATNPPDYSTNGAVWSPQHEVVWHLKENGFPYADGTLQHPALSGATPGSIAGVVGRGISLNGSQFLNAGAMDVGNSFTLSAWINISSSANDEQLIWANKTSGWNSDGFALFVNDYQTTDGTLSLATGDGTDGHTVITASGAVTPGAWYQVAAVVDKTGGTAKLYIDGVNRTQSGSIQSDFQNVSTVNMGRLTNGTFYFKGNIDEARIASGMCSSNWIWASWATVASNSTFESYSTITRQQPALTIGFGGNNGAVLNWPGSGVGFALCTATNLTPPIVWTLATNQPALTNNQWRINLSADNNNSRYYRLQSQ
jgi:hypothetical protein